MKIGEKWKNVCVFFSNVLGDGVGKGVGEGVGFGAISIKNWIWTKQYIFVLYLVLVFWTVFSHFSKKQKQKKKIIVNSE